MPFVLSRRCTRRSRRTIYSSAASSAMSSTLAYGALCRGLLSGRMTAATQFGGDDLRRHDPKFQMPRFQNYLDAVVALEGFAQEDYGKRVIHLALRLELHRGGTNIALRGAR